MGEASVGGGQVVEAQAQGVVSRCPTRRVGALHLDVELLARGDAGDASRSGSCRTGRCRWRSRGRVAMSEA